MRSGCRDNSRVMLSTTRSVRLPFASAAIKHQVADYIFELAAYGNAWAKQDKRRDLDWRGSYQPIPHFVSRRPVPTTSPCAPCVCQCLHRSHCDDHLLSGMSTTPVTMNGPQCCHCGYRGGEHEKSCPFK
ncbi:hypothetical protein CPB85DRAFT_804903 [Mucidula mucida]|nr:hypothetical protein CPB85DRAFT_804903 [Mucidula mucida]